MSIFASSARPLDIADRRLGDKLRVPPPRTSSNLVGPHLRGPASGILFSTVNIATCGLMH